MNELNNDDDDAYLYYIQGMYLLNFVLTITFEDDPITMPSLRLEH